MFYMVLYVYSVMLFYVAWLTQAYVNLQPSPGFYYFKRVWSYRLGCAEPAQFSVTREAELEGWSCSGEVSKPPCMQEGPPCPLTITLADQRDFSE